MVNVSIINKSNFDLPKYQTPQSAGVDLTANIEEEITLKPLERILVPTGQYIGLPEGYEAQIRPRSGLALKEGITVLNTPGTIDSDYRSEVKVILINLSPNDVVIKPGERIAQMVLNKVEQINWITVESLEETDRKGGFGSTGK